MVAKLRKPRRAAVSGVSAQIFRKELERAIKDVTAEFDEKIKGVKTDFESVFASLATSIASGKFDPRTFANAAARSVAPALRDFINKSIGQKGDDFLGLINKAQRNS